MWQRSSLRGRQCAASAPDDARATRTRSPRTTHGPPRGRPRYPERATPRHRRASATHRPSSRTCRARGAAALPRRSTGPDSGPTAACESSRTCDARSRRLPGTNGQEEAPERREPRSTARNGAIDPVPRIVPSGCDIDRPDAACRANARSRPDRSAATSPTSRTGSVARPRAGERAARSRPGCRRRPRCRAAAATENRQTPPCPREARSAIETRQQHARSRRGDTLNAEPMSIPENAVKCGHRLAGSACGTVRPRKSPARNYEPCRSSMTTRPSTQAAGIAASPASSPRRRSAGGRSRSSTRTAQAEAARTRTWRPITGKNAAGAGRSAAAGTAPAQPTASRMRQWGQAAPRRVGHRRVQRRVLPIAAVEPSGYWIFAATNDGLDEVPRRIA